MKIKIEIEDRGMKSMHEFEGEITRDRIIDFLDAIGIFPDEAEEVPQTPAPKYEGGRTLRDKLETFIRYEFPNAWFSSNELRERYETLRDDIKLSTVSTYLSRMYYDGVLERRGNRNQRQYCLVSEEHLSEMEYSGANLKDGKERAVGKW